ncbi:nitrite reductase small subunit NirD [Halomonas sp. HP20-15]|uniref:nitrite reductase small subunit NirD n=1 Tax=Halomonas sp. HP20-15 TaxID=3085901 RepID=UPI0029828BB9|nr:nitrite reductase small subunit NirD [Halomonas sp. HP20-15]MDW5377496.1 nitrite reductase small subunit NirD [Halomonas sp. HP20-15]
MGTATAIKNDVTWQSLCRKADLVEFSGVAAWLETVEGPAQVALFHVPGHETELFAVDNRDPFSGVNIIARGIVGDIKGEPVVASPLYKQHFRLGDGTCLERPDVRLRHWPVRFDGDRVMIGLG